MELLKESDLLLMSAARLYSLGVDLEAAREELRKLVDSGVSADAPEMIEAYNEFTEMDRQWKTLEAQFLALRNKTAKT